MKTKPLPGSPGESSGLPRRPDVGRLARGELRVKFRLCPADVESLRALTGKGECFGDTFRRLLRAEIGRNQ